MVWACWVRGLVVAGSGVVLGEGVVVAGSGVV